MKRILTVLGAAALVFGAAACSNDSAPAPAPSSAAVKTTTSVAPVTTTTAPPQTTKLSAEYCAKNQDPGCPLGSYVGPNAIPNPNGDGTWVPCEGSICTNPNHGAGPGNGGPDATTPIAPVTTTPSNPNPDQGRVEGAPCEGDGTWVHLDGGNAGHYGTEWMCRH